MLCISLINSEQTYTHCICQPCTQGEHVACIAVLFLLLVLLDIVLLVVAFTTYVPFFYIALGDISQEGLMSKKEIQQVPKCWEGSSLETASNSICKISCTKEPSVMTRIADILQKSGFTGKKEVMLLKGWTIIILNIDNQGNVQDMHCGMVICIAVLVYSYFFSLLFLVVVIIITTMSPSLLHSTW